MSTLRPVVRIWPVVAGAVFVLTRWLLSVAVRHRRKVL